MFKEFTDLDIKYINKLEMYCSYRERCKSEVEDKMNKLNILDHKRAQYINHLIQVNLLNEERYVQSFIRGKINIKNWGKHKIFLALRQKQIEPKIIQEFLNFVDNSDYEQHLEKLLHKKIKLIKETDPYKLRIKLYTFALSKGYEPELIQKTLLKIKHNA